MKNFYLSVISLLALVFAGCEEKVTCLHYNETDGVLEISKAAELHYVYEVAKKYKETRESFQTDNGRMIAFEDACLRLINDIEIKESWTPIPFFFGYSIKSFDGNNYKITFKDVEYILPATDDGHPANPYFMHYGLFESLSDCEVRNLLLEGEISVRNKDIVYDYNIGIGAVAGELTNGTVENCISRVKISFEDEKGCGKVEIGGITGGFSNISNSITWTGKIVNEGDISVKGCYSVYLGGLAGTAGDKIEISGNVNLENKGNLSVEWDRMALQINNEDSYNNIGGVFGKLEVYKGPVKNIYNCGNIIVNTQDIPTTFQLGGVCGMFGKSYDGRNLIEVFGMKNSGTIKVEGKGIGKYSCVGGVIGDCNSGYFHQLLNEGKIIIPDDSNLKIGGLLGYETGLGYTSYLLSCSEDKVGDFKVFNYSQFPLFEKVCTEKHDKSQE